MRYLFILLLSLLTLAVDAQTDFPCKGVTTTTLNVREGPHKSRRWIGQLTPHTEVRVLSRANPQWVKISYGSGVAYVNSNYLRFEPLPKPKTAKTDSGSGDWSLLSLFLDLLLLATSCFFTGVAIYICWRFLCFFFNVGAVLTDLAIRIFCFPFFLLNGCQRFLAKPWFIFFRENHFSDSVNFGLRIFFSILKVPLYVALFPVRFLNAVFFNLGLHVAFEYYNYLMEVIIPSDSDEGADSWGQWILYLPLRILKYPIYHGTLTFVESLVWTAVDCFLPALTLYHGTACSAAESIVAHPDRGGWHGRDTGLWIVGGGNFAGNGIYFASSRRTALHYSAGSLIICRVTLGRTLDLGLAPNHVYAECGHPDALGVTRWGLNNGYVTGEWWRDDADWWEYCMYDWQNRYNYSWRIRPLYVVDVANSAIQRIPGGMAHWLFRKIVFKDIFTSIGEFLDS